MTILHVDNTLRDGQDFVWGAFIKEVAERKIKFKVTGFVGGLELKNHDLVSVLCTERKDVYLISYPAALARNRAAGINTIPALRLAIKRTKPTVK